MILYLGKSRSQKLSIRNFSKHLYAALKYYFLLTVYPNRSSAYEFSIKAMGLLCVLFDSLVIKFAFWQFM